MRIQRDDDDDIRELFEHGSSSWVGPSPLASQSRWAAPAARHRVVHAARLVAVVVGFTVVVFGLTLVAASQSPSGAAATVMHLASHGFPDTPTTPGVPSGDSPPASASPAPGVTVQSATARPTPNPTPSAARRTEQEDRPPSPSGSALSSPRPSPSPGE